MKRRGFTLVELLVVIAIIAMLMGILMPALARVRQMAYRMVCGTNLGGIGKAMMLYSNDNEEEYPRAGGVKSWWGTAGCIQAWNATSGQREAFRGTECVPATISASFYLLIKYSDLTPKQFVCRGDYGTKEWKLSLAVGSVKVNDLTEAWDFYNTPGLYCSYSYHLPYDSSDCSTKGYPINSVSNASSPVCADRNPYLDKNAVVYLDAAAGTQTGQRAPLWDPTGLFYSDLDKTGNAAAHQRDGQNVLFNDIHVNFERYPNCGIENDNIWKHWLSTTPPTLQGKEIGVSITDGVPAIPQTSFGTNGVGKGMPMAYEDAYLVNEDQRIGFGLTQ